MDHELTQDRIQIAVAYEAAPGINSGLPVDISHVTWRFGVGAPVGVARAVYDEVLHAEADTAETERRLWDLAFAIGVAVKRLRGAGTTFAFVTTVGGQWKTFTLALGYRVVGTSSWFDVTTP